MDHWRDEFYSVQSQDIGAVLFDHCKCDVRLPAPLIFHFARCVPFGFVISTTVMTLMYILHLSSMCMVHGLYLRA